MKGNRAVLTVVAVLVVVLAGWWIFRRGARQTLDLMTLYGQAQKDGEPWRAGEGDARGRDEARNQRAAERPAAPQSARAGGWLAAGLPRPQA